MGRTRLEQIQNLGTDESTGKDVKTEVNNAAQTITGKLDALIASINSMTIAYTQGNQSLIGKLDI